MAYFTHICTIIIYYTLANAEIPRITNTIPDEREHLVGEESLIYTCQFEGDPFPNIIFYFNGAVVSPNSGVTTVGNTLTIAPLKPPTLVSTGALSAMSLGMTRQSGSWR